MPSATKAQLEIMPHETKVQLAIIHTSQKSLHLRLAHISDLKKRNSNPRVGLGLTSLWLISFLEQAHLVKSFWLSIKRTKHYLP